MLKKSVTIENHHQKFKPRVEDKYILTKPMLNAVRTYLQGKSRCRTFLHSTSLVNSLYLDNHSLSRVEHNLAGIAKREKLRIRWYDTKSPENYCYLELKQRNGKCISKERWCFHTSYLQKGAIFNIPSKEVMEIIPDALACSLKDGNIPILIVRYRREHFQLEQLPVRITLDYALKTVRVKPFSPFSPLGIERSFGCPILEIKYEPEHGEEFQKMNYLSPFNLRKSRYSKYLQACKALGPIVGKHADTIDQDGR